jgi:O-antigen/teichoic acid export membrane protein
LEAGGGWKKTVIDYIKSFLPEDGFARGVLMVAGGTSFGQAITVLVSPVLTRFYTPEEFGLLSVFTSVLAVAATIAAFRYEYAIPLAEDDEKAGNLVVLGGLIVAVTSVLSAVAVLTYGVEAAAWANVSGEITSYLWLIPLGIFGEGIYQVLNYRVTRAKEFSGIGYTRVSRKAGQAGTQVGGGIAGIGAIGLIAGAVVGRFAGITALARRAKIRLRHFNLQGCLEQAKRWYRFPLYTAWGSMINVVGSRAPPILLSRFFMPGVAGHFSLTLRVLSLPAAVIGRAFGQVFYPLAAEREGSEEKQREMVERTATILLLISLPIFTFVGLLGPTLFTWVFGESWQTAGQYAQYLAPWLALSFISSPLSTFVFAKEEQGRAFGITIYETTLRLSVLWVGGNILESPTWTVLMYSGAGIIISLFYIGWVLRLSGSGLLEWARKVKWTLMGGSFIAGLLALSKAAVYKEIYIPFFAIVLLGFGAHSALRIQELIDHGS